MPRILLLAATTGYQLRSFDEAARRAGVALVLATDRCHALDDPWQDRALPVRFDALDESVATIVDALASAPPAGVVVVGDRPLVLAARAAAALGVPGNPSPAVERARSKIAARTAFAAAGLPGPWFHAVAPSRDPDDAARDGRVRYPCVLKPIGLSGSRGVIRADTPEAFVAALGRIRRLLARPDVRASRGGGEGAAAGEVVLVEGFVPGAEVAVEGVLTGGRLRVLAIFEKPDPLDGPFFEETIYLLPARLPAGEAEAIGATVQRAVEALGLRHGPIHAECRLSQGAAVMLEVAPRPIGGLCSRVLRLVHGDARGRRHTLEDVLLRHARGDDISGWRREAQPAGVMMVPIPARGVLRGVDGVASAAAVPAIEDVRITAKIGQLLEPLPEAGSYLGFLFARAATTDAVDAALREAHRRLTFRIAPAIDVAPADASASV